MEMAIRKLNREEQQTMDTYYVSEQMLGQFATEQDAQQMVHLLKERGHNVEYGTQINRIKPIPDDVWFDCLNQVHTFMQIADDTSNE